MNNSDEPPLCRFGTPLEPLEEDDVASKKRVPIEEQIVTDENGRRRFHGAFTGGFSAGFWNTVGSLEGWKPQSFKSSRSDKAVKRQVQAPTDFMDDEDLGEFGIAPQRVQARKDFEANDRGSTRKRKLENKDAGSIPGIPVLQQLLEPSREKVAVRLLRRMGWKPGQGIGARQTRKEKTYTKERNNKELYIMKMYGCAVKPSDRPMEGSADNLSDLSDEDELTFAPDDFEPFICKIKDNRFGLGYSGLNRQLSTDTTSHINLFGSLEVIGKSNKKLSIRGQAFGVGALEEEDDDIYAKDDMSKYDFSLGNKSKGNKIKLLIAQDLAILDGFAEPGSDLNLQKTVHRIELNSNFIPRIWSQRKTRFEPLAKDKISLTKQTNLDRRKNLGRHDLNPDERGDILDTQKPKSSEIKNDNEEVNKKKSYLQHVSEKYKEREETNKKILQLLSFREDNFVRGGLITDKGVKTIGEREVPICENIKNENNKLLTKAMVITKSIEKTSEIFKPFANNGSKQERYEKFIRANLKQNEDIKAFLHNIQPVHLSDWDREMEQKEFIQARNIYKPLNGLMSERFVSKSVIDFAKITPQTEDNKKIKGNVKQTKSMWKPSVIICKRFNIPEPFGSLIEPKVIKNTKFSVFDYIENSINSKQDFITPVIIPKSVKKPEEIKTQTKDLTTESFSRKKKFIPSNDIPHTMLSNDKPHTIIPEVEVIKPHQTCTNVSNKTKTELEIRVLESINKHPSEKKDLFMSIFDSSSEDEEHEKTILENSSETANTDEIVETVIKPSAPINVLRNTSPPRGIFAALFSSVAPNEKIKQQAFRDEPEYSGKITFKPKHQRIEHEKPDCAYGPKVPTNFIIENREFSQEDNIDKKLTELLSKKSTKATKIVETWIEKTGQSRQKNKKVKKEKKKKDFKESEKTKNKYKKYKNKK